MTQEDRNLLLRDLCARLPYTLIGIYSWKGNAPFERELTGELYNELSLSWGSTCDSEFIPYLCPMSSMTEEENEELKYAIELCLQALDCEEGHNTVSAAPAAFEVDFYNKHHFDYRGLIEKGLALEAPVDMYKND